MKENHEVIWGVLMSILSLIFIFWGIPQLFENIEENNEILPRCNMVCDMNEGNYYCVEICYRSYINGTEINDCDFNYTFKTFIDGCNERNLLAKK